MKISEITEFLENAFDALNERYFNGELPRVIITVQSSNRGVLGHFTPWDSWREENTGYKEINISAENLSRPIENVIATLQHENTHFYCNLNNIKDTSRGGVYHNKHFKEQAEKRGLIIDYDKRIGFSLTTPSPELIEFIKEQGWSDIDLSRNSEDLLSFGGGSGRTTKPSSTRKYICPCCHKTTVRATKFVNIACLDCNEVMVIEEK